MIELLAGLAVMCWFSFVVCGCAKIKNKDILHPYETLDWNDDEETDNEIYVQDEYGFYHEVTNDYFIDTDGKYKRLTDKIGPFASDDQDGSYIKDGNTYRKWPPYPKSKS